MEIIPLYKFSSKVLVGLECDFGGEKVIDGLVVEIDIQKQEIINTSWSLQLKLKFGYYESVELTERKTLSDEIERTFPRTIIFEIEDLLLNPGEEAVDSLVWVPERLKKY